MIASAVRRTQAAGRIAQQGLEGVGEGYENGSVFETPISSNVRTMLGTAGNIPLQAGSAIYDAYQKMALQFGKEVGQPGMGRDIALIPEAMMAYHAPHPSEVGIKSPQAKEALGPWDAAPKAQDFPDHQAII